MKEQVSKLARPARALTRSAKASGALAASSLGSLLPSKGGYRWKSCKGKPHAWLMGTDNAVCSVCGRTVPKGEASNQPDPEEVTGPRQYPDWIVHVWRKEPAASGSERWILRNVKRGADVAELTCAADGSTYRWWLLQDPSINSDKERHRWLRSVNSIKSRVVSVAKAWQWKCDQAREAPKVKRALQAQFEARRAAILATQEALRRHTLQRTLRLGAETVLKEAKLRAENPNSNWTWAYDQGAVFKRRLLDPHGKEWAAVDLDPDACGSMRYLWSLTDDASIGGAGDSGECMERAEDAIRQKGQNVT